MTVVGVILLILGLAAAGLDLTNNMPAVIADYGIPLWVWIIVTVVGALLMYLNRRPGN